MYVCEKKKWFFLSLCERYGWFHQNEKWMKKKKIPKLFPNQSEPSQKLKVKIYCYIYSWCFRLWLMLLHAYINMRWRYEKKMPENIFGIVSYIFFFCSMSTKKKWHWRYAQCSMYNFQFFSFTASYGLSTLNIVYFFFVLFKRFCVRSSFIFHDCTCIWTHRPLHTKCSFVVVVECKKNPVCDEIRGNIQIIINISSTIEAVLLFDCIKCLSVPAFACVFEQRTMEMHYVTI